MYPILNTCSCSVIFSFKWNTYEKCFNCSLINKGNSSRCTCVQGTEVWYAKRTGIQKHILQLRYMTSFSRIHGLIHSQSIALPASVRVLPIYFMCSPRPAAPVSSFTSLLLLPFSYYLMYPSERSLRTLFLFLICNIQHLLLTLFIRSRMYLLFSFTMRVDQSEM